MQTQDKLEDQPDVPANVNAGKCVTDVYSALRDVINTDRNADELDRLLSDRHFKVLTEQFSVYFTDWILMNSIYAFDIFYKWASHFS